MARYHCAEAAMFLLGANCDMFPAKEHATFSPCNPRGRIVSPFDLHLHFHDTNAASQCRHPRSTLIGPSPMPDARPSSCASASHTWPHRSLPFPLHARANGGNVACSGLLGHGTSGTDTHCQHRTKSATHRPGLRDCSSHSPPPCDQQRREPSRPAVADSG